MTKKFFFFFFNFLKKKTPMNTAIKYYKFPYIVKLSFKKMQIVQRP